MVTPSPTDIRIVSCAERPELLDAVPALLRSRWPRFMLEGRPGHRADLAGLVRRHPGHQVMMLDKHDRLLGAGISLPLHWDATIDGLPAGWDGAVDACAAWNHDRTTVTAVCALSVTTASGSKRRDFPARILTALRSAAADAGAETLIVPVRPVLKTRYPLTPIERYLAWRTGDGDVFDPWLRLHMSLGGRLLGVTTESMKITGTVAEWEDWLSMPLPDAGRYVIAGGLQPLLIDREGDLGTYLEPNVWVAHSTQQARDAG